MRGTARADLVWTPQTGWRVEGGALSGLTGSEGNKALALMNKARRLEENGDYLFAIHYYTKVAKKYSSSIYAPEAYYRTAELYIKRHEYFLAFQAFQNTLGHYPSEKRFTLITEEEYRIASLLLDGAHSRMWGIIPVFTESREGRRVFPRPFTSTPLMAITPPWRC